MPRHPHLADTVRRHVALGAFWLALGAVSTARAGGYDALMWHSARHLGMAGAAVAHVSDPAAVFHNPAGLAHVERAQVLGSLALLAPRLHAAPAAGVNIAAQSAVAPVGLLGAALRVTDWLVAGVAAFPIAAAGASYRYEGVVGPTDDRTRAALVEASPALGVTLPHGFKLGVGYRVTGMHMARYTKGEQAQQPGIDIALWGIDWLGLRAGAQWERVWQASPVARRALSLGLSYRHVVGVEVDGEGGYALATRLRSVQTRFTLPARLAVGARGDLGRASLVVDLELGLNSQNDREAMRVELQDGRRVELPNIFGWHNTLGARVGAEYRLLGLGRLPVRLGYALDGSTIPKRYPTAFGPPPVATHMVTGGVGWRAPPFEFNAAYSYRFGATSVSDGDTEGADPCAFCGHPGRYEVQAHGIYVDASYRIGDP